VRLLTRLLALLGALLLPLLPVSPALAMGVRDIPPPGQNQHVIDRADLFSRSTLSELEKRLSDLEADHVEARLVTVPRLDYGEDLESLGQQLLNGWAAGAGPLPASQLLLLIDAQTNMAAAVATDDLLEQLPESLLRSTADTTMAIPIRLGARYRQASLDALNRLGAVLGGGEDPGPPLQQEVAPVVSNVPSHEETAAGNGFLWVVVLLVVGTIVPMVTWWVFSR
jgi:uncharacterized protein